MPVKSLRPFLLALVFALGLGAQPNPPDFVEDVQPLLSSCLACHSAQLEASGLALDSREALLKVDRAVPP